MIISFIVDELFIDLQFLFLTKYKVLYGCSTSPSLHHLEINRLQTIMGYQEKVLKVMLKPKSDQDKKSFQFPESQPIHNWLHWEWVKLSQEVPEC